MSDEIKTHTPPDPITADIVAIHTPKVRAAMALAYTEARVKLIATGKTNVKANNEALSVVSQLAATAMLAATEELALVMPSLDLMGAFNLMRIDIVRRAELRALEAWGCLLRQRSEEAGQDDSK